jgi:hypothetical protein
LLIDKTDDEEANEKGAMVPAQSKEMPEPLPTTYICRACGGPMVIIDCFERGQLSRAPPVRIIAA